MRSLPVLFALLLWYPATASAAETSRLAFVTEYVRAALRFHDSPFRFGFQKRMISVIW
jgi:hypothetical protein